MALLLVLSGAFGSDCKVRFVEADRLWGLSTADRVATRPRRGGEPMRKRQATIEDLRRAIDGLPRDTRVAMLEGIRQNDIIAGAYADHGGICPMLAAYRAGGRAGCISFAKAWDAFAFRGARRRLARRATRRELLVLTCHLEASLLDDDPATTDLGTAIAQHEELVQGRPGWSWLRVMRRFDEYERALALIESGGSDFAAAAPSRRPAELVPTR